MPKPCDRPPVGWDCSREAGHDGPCAASPNPQPGVSGLGWSFYELAVEERDFERSRVNNLSRQLESLCKEYRDLLAYTHELEKDLNRGIH